MRRRCVKGVRGWGTVAGRKTKSVSYLYCMLKYVYVYICLGCTCVLQVSHYEKDKPFFF